ncbi:hypothetical protein [Streptomyces sp. NPDC050388]|uniref:hypothetical protein n=1 Tax=Streptomyces sp. NPDC050388 TaxID=3155781 RepID=UPI00341715C2
MGKAVSFYRYLAFDLPVLTTLSPLGLLLGFAAVRVWTLFTHREVPGYFTAYLALLAAGSVLAVVGVAQGRAARAGGPRRRDRFAWARAAWCRRLPSRCTSSAALRGFRTSGN